MKGRDMEREREEEAHSEAQSRSVPLFIKEIHILIIIFLI